MESGVISGIEVWDEAVGDRGFAQSWGGQWEQCTVMAIVTFLGGGTTPAALELSLL